MNVVWIQSYYPIGSANIPCENKSAFMKKCWKHKAIICSHIYTVMFAFANGNTRAKKNSMKSQLYYHSLLVCIVFVFVVVSHQHSIGIFNARQLYQVLFSATKNHIFLLIPHSFVLLLLVPELIENVQWERVTFGRKGQFLSIFIGKSNPLPYSRSIFKTRSRFSDDPVSGSWKSLYPVAID